MAGALKAVDLHSPYFQSLPQGNKGENFYKTAYKNLRAKRSAHAKLNSNKIHTQINISSIIEVCPLFISIKKNYFAKFGIPVAC